MKYLYQKLRKEKHMMNQKKTIFTVDNRDDLIGGTNEKKRIMA